jgi:hypothetical protein
MQKQTFLLLAASCLALVILFFSFKPLQESSTGNSINLRWNKAYEAESWINISTGLLWSFSLIGADLPKGGFERAITFAKDSSIFSLDFSQLGFSTRTLSVLAKYNQDLIHSQEYTKFNAIDLGRWLVYVIYSGNHYYELVDAPKTLTEFKKLHPQNTLAYLIDKSAVSLSTRKVQFYEDSILSKLFFIAQEGNYDSLQNKWNNIESETLDILPNTQPRFAIYGADGNLKMFGDTLHSKAGKIAKCMWCHESKIEKLFTITHDFPGFLSRAEFESKVDKMNAKIFETRKNQNTDLQWFNRFDHTQSELLYITFMQSSSARISKEWQVPIKEVNKLFTKYKTEKYLEFPFLGELYPRSLIDSLTAVPVVKVPYFVREASTYEPN